MNEKMEYLDLCEEETELLGAWIVRDGEAVADNICRRINWLLANRLEKICTDSSGWELLLRDPNDGRYWERTYPQSEMHGGGPPLLKVLSLAQAQLKYEI
jgi:hypothetical protein